MSASKLAKRQRFAKNQQEHLLDQEIQQKVDSSISTIESNCALVENHLIRQKFGNSSINRIFHNFTEVWLKWLEFDIKKFEEDAFSGKETQEFSLLQIPGKVKDEGFWKSFNLFSSCKHLKWTVRFTEKARKKVLFWTNVVRVNLLRQLITYSCGYLMPGINCTVISEGPCANMVYLSTSIKGTDQILVFAILMNRLPIVRQNKLVQFRFEHYLKVIDVIKKNKDVRTSVDQHKSSIKNDPDKWIEPLRDEDGKFIYSSFELSVQRNSQNICSPKVFSRIYLNLKESAGYKYDKETGRWVSEDLILIKNNLKEIDPYLQSVINTLGNASSGQEFVNFIRRIPGFKVKLTQEQEALVKSSGNVLAIGRSGTGKTTCSILRLLTTEMLFRYTVRDRSKRFTPEDIDRSTVLHTVFVTASPVLTNEVKVFYSKIGSHIKEKLKERDEKIIEKAEIEYELEQLKSSVVSQEIDIENQSENEVSSDSEEEIQGPSSLEFMRDEDFPCFATVRKIVFMVDAAMKRPFFSRDKEGNVIGSSSKFQWHNELKGALAINKEFKANKQTEETGKIEESESESESDLEIENNRPQVFKSRPFKSRTIIRQAFRKLSYEVDFRIFSTKFFPRIKHKADFSALVLWTEISAYIKGSSQSYKYPGYYLPRHVYINLGRKASMLTVNDKNTIWDLFIEYERWKNREDAYDMQDVVNYLLNQISFYGYNGVPIHYMMVDEVQDLTPATLYLLILLTKKQLFFSGDTAQTIAKGVGFRFCDLKGLFVESKIDTPTICQLTMNFRTHNQILGVANSVVALLETLFPLTIDKMAKEVSPKDGPMPSVLDSNNVEDLVYILFGNTESEQTESEFGCNQVIIVRNQESKENLPPMLKHALCLTVYEAKGLEFEDVILFNFFAESEAPKNIWTQLRLIQKASEDCSKRPDNFEELEEGVPKLKSSIPPNDASISILCTELKHLYVAVTRARRHLIIFDEDSKLRKGMVNFWKMMGVINLATVIKSPSGEVIHNAFGEKFAKKTTKEEWKAQGVKMFSNKYYEQAKKCFEISGDLSLCLRAEGYTLANKATQILADTESSILEFQASVKKATKGIKREWKFKKALAKDLYIQAGNNFLKVSEDPTITDARKVLKEAARCYSSGQAHRKAAEIYKSISLFGQAGEAELACGNFEEAGDMFLNKNEYTRAIEAYKLGLNWDKLVKTIYKYKDQMGVEERQKYIQKYVPAAFEDLTPKLVPASDQETNYIVQIKSETQKIIIENSDEDSSNEEIIEGKTEVYTKKEDPKEPEENSESFVLLSKQNSFSLLSDEIEDVDPDDEWLQIETGSVVESLDSVINPDGSIASDFSLFERPGVKSKGKLIKTRGDIFIEDTTMRKIIEYVGMFSEEVGTYLKSLRSKSSLVSSQVFNQDWELVSLIDLDDISPEMLGLLLDILEEYGMYKLCLIVCNRYNLVERAGRFIVSLAFKYSNISILTYSSFKLNTKEQVQRAAIAFTAVHNVFEMINPEYLKAEKDNQIGFDVFQGLVLLGYWKKVIYLLDKENGLAVAWCFSDLKSYINILKPDIEDIYTFDWLTGDEDSLALQHLVVGLDLVRSNLSLKTVPSFYVNTLKALKVLNTCEDAEEFLTALSDEISAYFSGKKKYSKLGVIEVLDCVSAWSVVLMGLDTSQIYEKIKDFDIYKFEKFMMTTNYIIKYLMNPSLGSEKSTYLRHCILSPAGVRSIPFSTITNDFPVYSHCIIHSSSPFISTLSKHLYPIDLEAHSYLVPLAEVNSVYIESVTNSINYIIEGRKRSLTGLQGLLNSLSENWLSSFISSPNSYSLGTFDCTSNFSPKLLKDYTRLKENLEDLKGEDISDILYNKFMLEKNDRKIRKLEKKINAIQKQLELEQINEKYYQVLSFASEVKYFKNDQLQLTRASRQALLTYSQVLINSSENVSEDLRDTRVWIAYELCRVSDQMGWFIEMLRSRHRPVVRNGKKISNLSIAYHNAVGYADLNVYDKLNCFDSSAETILNLLEVVELDDDMKIFLLQKSVVSWLFSYKNECVLHASLERFWQENVKSTKNTGKIRINVLEKAFQLFLQYSTMPITDEVKENYISLILDSLSVVLYYIQKDQLALDCKNKFLKHSGYHIGKSLKPGHVCFKLLDEYPDFKSSFKGKKVTVEHIEFPEQALDQAWVAENKAVAGHQRCANLIKKVKKSHKIAKAKPFVASLYEILNCKVLDHQKERLLETCNKYLSDLYHCLYRIALFKSLDLHFLLDQIKLVSGFIRTIDQCSVLESKISKDISQLEIWKIHVKPTSEEFKQKLKKKWNVKWKSKSKAVKNR